MHDTAYNIGRLVIESYLPADVGCILDIGSLDVNGTLRDHAPPDTEYIGLDFEAGPGVDHVLRDGDDWPVPDSHFDLVIASSAFEHDSAFWRTFLRMCRKVKPGGYLYISAPSNGAVHRYPRDCWRFYPDAGLALAELGRAEGFGVTLMESFIAERDADIWNDFCAVFRMGPVDDETVTDYVHAKVRATNVLTWQTATVLNDLPETEDMRLLAAVAKEQATLQAGLREEQSQVAALEQVLEEGREQHRNENARLVTAHNAVVADLSAARDDALARLEALQARLDGVQERNRELASNCADLQGQVDVATRLAADRKRKIADLASTVVVKEQAISRVEAEFVWLRQVASVLVSAFARPPRMGAYLPLSRRGRLKRRLCDQGLFDEDAYLAAQADVRDSGMDPLWHYLEHGITEMRPRT